MAKHVYYTQKSDDHRHESFFLDRSDLQLLTLAVCRFTSSISSMSTNSNLDEESPLVASPPPPIPAVESVAVVSSATSDTEESGRDVCRLAMGKVCICVTCEATRERMVNRNTTAAKRRRSSSVTGTDAVALLPPRKKKDSQGVKDEEEQMKIEKMQQACQTILECIGEDPTREGLVKTPNRWAKALLFMTQGYQQICSDVTNGAVFEENHDEMVVVRDIDIHSLCEHHMVPFSGRVHIGYIPNGKIIGLSKLARIAEMFARRLQVQERLTRQIADAVVEAVNPLGVGVVIECSHFCMVMRGVQKVGATTVTSSVRGCFEKNSKTRAEFFSIIHKGQIKMC